ncbi:MAG: hypothetical protein ACYDCQ_14245, partial [Dehalococcoidia bacterium]
MTMTWPEPELNFGRRGAAPGPLPAPETALDEATAGRLARLRSGTPPRTAEAPVATAALTAAGAIQIQPWELHDAPAPERFSLSRRLLAGAAGLLAAAALAFVWAAWPHGSAHHATA